MGVELGLDEGEGRGQERGGGVLEPLGPRQSQGTAFYLH